MNRDRANDLVIACALGLAAGLLLVRDCVTDAHAQDRGDLDAGRCLVAETDARQPDLDATAHVLVRRARLHGRTPSQEARRYCAMYVARHPSERQRAIAVLVPDTHSQRGRQLTVALDALVAVRVGERPDPCAASATDWGDAYSDARRARAAGWLEVSCGATRDRFWIAVHRVGHSR